MSFILDNVSYRYSEKTAYEITALDHVNLQIGDGEFIGVIGHTGSGKSTLIQHLNGLLKATEGTIYFNGQDIYEEDYDLRDLRMQVGMVFQYPEHQLFEETVFKDVCFGPKNLGLSHILFIGSGSLFMTFCNFVFSSQKEIKHNKVKNRHNNGYHTRNIMDEQIITYIKNKIRNI